MQTNRRTLLAALPAAAVVAAVPATSMALPADRREWDHVMALYGVAVKEHADYEANIHSPAWQAERDFEEAHGVFVRTPEGGWSRTYLEDRRQLWEKRGKAHCMPEHIDEHMDALTAAMSDAGGRVLETPAPDMAALRWKLDYLTGGEAWDGWSPEFVQQTLADIARLMPAPR